MVIIKESNPLMAMVEDKLDANKFHDVGQGKIFIFIQFQDIQDLALIVITDLERGYED